MPVWGSLEAGIVYLPKNSAVLFGQAVKSDKIVQKKCWKYCMEVGRLLNFPYLKYTEEKTRDWNITFLQEMYYQNKIRCGYQMLFQGKEEKVGGT